MVRIGAGLVALVLALGAAGNAAAAPADCQNGQSFDAWLAAFRREAAAEGIGPQAIASGLDGAAFDRGIVQRDHGQGVFRQTFLQFSDRMAAGYRITRGQQVIARNAATFSRIEAQFGVPPAVISALWGLETDFGAVNGSFPTIRSLVTLAYDCRRPDMFRDELKDALRLVQRGDLAPSQMRGAWAGELGQTQFMPSSYMKFGVDFDGDGRVDLIHSVPDVLASTAHYMQGYGWRRGEPWLTEVRAPAALVPQAGLGAGRPSSEWSRLGVKLVSGAPLPAGGPAASLLMPMGASGPAFLAYPNFAVFKEWNKSTVYSLTAAYLASRIAGAPAVQRNGSGL